MKHQWNDFAVIESSKGGKEWKVQVNEEGSFRCSCPSFIFSKVVPRTCKHCRRCEEQRMAEGMQKTAAPSYASEAARIVVAMTRAARVSVTSDQERQMCEVLAARLTVFSPRAAEATTATVVVGVRRITFDD